MDYSSGWSGGRLEVPAEAGMRERRARHARSARLSVHAQLRECSRACVNFLCSHVPSCMNAALMMLCCAPPLDRSIRAFVFPMYDRAAFAMLPRMCEYGISILTRINLQKIISVPDDDRISLIIEFLPWHCCRGCFLCQFLA